MTIKFKPIFIIVFCMFNLNYAKGQSKELTSVFLEKLTWTEVKEFIDNGGKSIIIPTGGTEQNCKSSAKSGLFLKKCLILI